MGNVIVVTYTVGCSSGYTELIGIYTDAETARKAVLHDSVSKGRNINNYRTEHIKTNEAINTTIFEW